MFTVSIAVYSPHQNTVVLCLEIFIRLHKSTPGWLHGRQPRNLYQHDLSQDGSISWQILFLRVRSNRHTLIRNVNDQEFAFAKEGPRSIHQDDQIDNVRNLGWQGQAERRVFGNDNDWVVATVDHRTALQGDRAQLRTIGVTEIIGPLTRFGRWFRRDSHDFFLCNAWVGSGNLNDSRSKVFLVQLFQRQEGRPFTMKVDGLIWTRRH
mmetsp:Transcript_22767/g.37708  ORF Transcript_22767/g.37708 Transcript_22767/m.37708 type:complete len:208 (-) Transcript_22767:178-801(-)